MAVSACPCGCRREISRYLDEKIGLELTALADSRVGLGLLLVLPSEVAIKVRDPNAPIALEASSELFDHDGCEDCLPSSGNAWAKQRLLVGIRPHFELCRV
jgi:hypothetical protein